MADHPSAPNRAQLNAFCRLLLAETDVPIATLTEQAVLHAWYYAQEDLSIEARHMEWLLAPDAEDPEVIGFVAAVKLQAAVAMELDKGLEQLL